MNFDVLILFRLELEVKLHEDLIFTITEKAPNWLNAPTILALSHIRHYAKQVIAHGKLAQTS